MQNFSYCKILKGDPQINTLTLTPIQILAVWALPILLSITLHEAAHAWVAHKCGDNTAKKLNRLSLNPFRHIDIMGTVFVPILVALLSHFQFIFGWAKPVPIDWRQLHHPRRDMALVAAAGPFANFILALLFAACFKLGIYLGSETSALALFMRLTGRAGVLINLILGLLNLIPIPPLDGSRIAASFLPRRLAMYYLSLEPFGFLILLLLLLSGILGWMLYLPVTWVMNLINN